MVSGTLAQLYTVFGLKLGCLSVCLCLGDFLSFYPFLSVAAYNLRNPLYISFFPREAEDQ